MLNVRGSQAVFNIVVERNVEGTEEVKDKKTPSDSLSPTAAFHCEKGHVVPSKTEKRKAHRFVSLK